MENLRGTSLFNELLGILSNAIQNHEPLQKQAQEEAGKKIIKELEKLPVESLLQEAAILPDLWSVSVAVKHSMPKIETLDELTKEGIYSVYIRQMFLGWSEGDLDPGYY